MNWKSNTIISKIVILQFTFLVVSFDGMSAMKSKGSFKATLKANGKEASCEFIVVEGVRDNLLGFWSCIDLGLIQLTYAIKPKMTSPWRSNWNIQFCSPEKLSSWGTSS